MVFLAVTSAEHQLLTAIRLQGEKACTMHGYMGLQELQVCYNRLLMSKRLVMVG